MVEHRVDTVGNYIVVNKFTGAEIKNCKLKLAIDPGRERADKTPSVKNKEGDYIDMAKRKYKQTLKTSGEIQEVAPEGEELEQLREHSLANKKLIIKQEILSGSKRAPLAVIEIQKKGKLQAFFRLSQKQIWLLQDIICSMFLKLVEVDLSQMHFCNEVLVYIALLREPKYIISSENLIKMGATRQAASSLLRSLEKRGDLLYVGNVGMRRMYTCKIPREQLAEMFKPYSEEGD